MGIGYCLRAASRRFVVFERGRVGETWRSQRWDSFAVDTPNYANSLPGDPYDGDQPDGFYRRDELIDHFEHDTVEHGLPSSEGVRVTEVDANGHGVRLTTQDATGAVDNVTATNVVVASGTKQAPKIPRLGERFPESLPQPHRTRAVRDNRVWIGHLASSAVPPPPDRA